MTVQAVLQLLGAVEEEALFRLCGLHRRPRHRRCAHLRRRARRPGPGSRPARHRAARPPQARDARAAHGRGAPDSLPLTDETRERLRAQAEPARRGDGPAPLRPARSRGRRHAPGRRSATARFELALVKVTRPAADLERESVAYRLEQLESVAIEPCRRTRSRDAAGGATPGRVRRSAFARARAAPGGVAADDPPAVEQRSIRRPRCSARRTRRSSRTTSHRRVPAAASFHRQLAEEPKNATLLAEALYEVTGRKLALDFAVGENGGEDPGPGRGRNPAGEDEIVQLMKDNVRRRRGRRGAVTGMRLRLSGRKRTSSSHVLACTGAGATASPALTARHSGGDRRGSRAR